MEAPIGTLYGVLVGFYALDGYDWTATALLHLYVEIKVGKSARKHSPSVCTNPRVSVSALKNWP